MTHADTAATVQSDPRGGYGPVRWTDCNLQETKAATERLETGMN